MGTVARPLSAEQELATQQPSTCTPPTSDHTAAQHHRIIATVSPRYQQQHQQQHGRSSEPRSHWPLLGQDAPVPLPSDPVIGMLHPSIFLASSLLLAHSHGDLQPSQLHHDSSEARLLQVTSGANIRGDLLIGVPVSFLFPTIGFNTIYRKSGKQERRMEDRDPEEDWRRNPLLS